MIKEIWSMRIKGLKHDRQNDVVVLTCWCCVPYVHTVEMSIIELS